jgi:curved DNA-binding protein CbpA
VASNRKKTLYEILGVSKGASYPEINVAHQRLLEQPEQQQGSLTTEERDFKLKVIHLAFQTLSTPMSRDAYDAKLASQDSAAGTLERPNPFALQTSASTVPLQADALSFKAEAMSLRAEAMSLRAEAMSLRVGAVAQNSYALAGDSSVATGLFSTVKRVAVMVGALLAVGMVVQVATVMIASRNGGTISSREAKARQQTALQEYNQTHGIAPGTTPEAAALDAKNRREENEQRIAEREKHAQIEKSRRFEEESRRKAEQATANIHNAEARSKERAQIEEQQLKFQKEQETTRKENAERYRIEQEKAQWRAVMNH